MKTLIAYSTRWGATAKTARVIADTLKETDGRETRVLDARKVGRREIEAYDAFVVGSSIAAGRWKGPARRLLARLAAAGKPTAVFVTAAGVLSGKEPGSDPDVPPKGTLEERTADAVARYVDPAASKAGLEPAAKSAFGGRMAFFGKVIIDNWEAEPVNAWARELADRFR